MKYGKAMLSLVLLLGLSGLASADVLILQDGEAITGKFQGGDPSGVSFLVNGQVRRYQLSDVQSITILPTPATPAASAPASAPSYSTGRTGSAPAPSSSSTGLGGRASTTTTATSQNMGVTLPTGTLITVRMIDPVDSSVNEMGQTFRASLDEPLVVNGRTIATRGVDATTKLVSVEQAGRMTGRSELALVLLDITIGGRKYEVTSGEVSEASASRGAQTAKRVGGLAAVGAVIGAIAGGGKGAAQGAAAGAGAGAAVQILTHGQNVQIPSESRLEFTLASPLNL